MESALVDRNLEPAGDCRVCGASVDFLFNCRVLGRSVRYFDCSQCGYVQTETPYWLADAYLQPIGDADTGIMVRNRSNVGHVLTALAAQGNMRGKVIDVGGGYGILVRMLRDRGVDAQWRDKHCDNLFARGFEADRTGYDLATAFEVIEHLEHPLEVLADLLAQSRAVLLSTSLAPSRDKLTPAWWYLVPEYGQHIGFMRQSTLDWIAKRLGCAYATDGTAIHIFAHDPSVVRRWAMLRRMNVLASCWARFRLRGLTMHDFNRMRARICVGEARDPKGAHDHGPSR